MRISENFKTDLDPDLSIFERHFFTKMKNQFHQKWMSVINNFKSVPHKSTLTTDGKLTPEEFVAAGDGLIANCPAWSWSSAPEGKAVDYLPKDKQYLINRRVVCQTRASDLSNFMQEEIDIGDGWCQAGEKAAQQAQDLEADDEVLDLDEIDIDDVEPEDTSVPKADYRTYDITICYDKYYNVAHIFMYGVDSDGVPLNLQQMYQDISADHADKTVTYEDHPFTSTKNLSIHPCLHGHVMVGFINRLEHPEKFCAPMYFFIFLKFIHTVIPTIDISTPTLDLEA